MSWSPGNIAYLALVVTGFTVFMLTVGYGSWQSSRKAPKAEAAKTPAPLPPVVAGEPSLKVHGDKLGHSMDVAL